MKDMKEVFSFDKGAKLDLCFLNMEAYNEELIHSLII